MNEQTYQATPRSELLRQLFDSHTPKSEREHCAMYEILALKKGLEAVKSLMEESHGVYGLHLNGDTAPWEDLRMGGKYEEWLFDLDKALERIKSEGYKRDEQIT